MPLFHKRKTTTQSQQTDELSSLNNLQENEKQLIRQAVGYINQLNVSDSVKSDVKSVFRQYAKDLNADRYSDRTDEDAHSSLVSVTGLDNDCVANLHNLIQDIKVAVVQNNGHGHGY